MNMDGKLIQEITIELQTYTQILHRNHFICFLYHEAKKDLFLEKTILFTQKRQ